MQIVKTVLPTNKVLELEQVKSFLRVDNEDENVLIEMLIDTAYDECERYTNRTILTTTWAKSFDYVPGWISSLMQPEGFNLSYGPIQSLVSMVLLLSDGTNRTLNLGDYQLSQINYDGVVSLAYGKSWWADVVQPRNGITITYTAGYGDTAASVPGGLKLGMLQYIAHVYENRDADINTMQQVQDSWDKYVLTTI